MSDLISRSALIQHAYSAVVDGVEKDIIDLSDVDNAPSVPQINILCENADEKAIADMKEELQKVIDDLRPQGDIRWTDKLSVKSNGDIIDFEGRVVGHIDSEVMKGGSE